MIAHGEVSASQRIVIVRREGGLPRPSSEPTATLEEALPQAQGHGKRSLMVSDHRCRPIVGQRLCRPFNEVMEGLAELTGVPRIWRTQTLRAGSPRYREVQWGSAGVPTPSSYR